LRDLQGEPRRNGANRLQGSDVALATASRADLSEKL
jgi:hypothetical protein